MRLECSDTVGWVAGKVSGPNWVMKQKWICNK